MQQNLDNLSDKKALDELFEASAHYRNSQHFFDLLKFINKFPRLAPFNAFLIHMQNAGVELVMAPSKWKEYRRTIKYNSRPLIILKPFTPVEFVYDIADTVGPALPDEILNFFCATGELDEKVFDYTKRNCAKINVNYQEYQMHKGAAGHVVPTLGNSYDININAAHTLNVRYASLVHELGHVYAGHVSLNRRRKGCIPRPISEQAMEIEAEAISYLVCKRIGINTSSESYLSKYIRSHKELPDISLDIILTAAGQIEKMGKKGFSAKNIPMQWLKV